MKPTVSVIMPFRNEERWIQAAVTSVLTQSLVDIELVAIDDQSTDASRKLVDELGDNRVVVVDGEGRGIVAALNLGLARARGEFVARMDADDLSVPSRLEQQVGMLSADPLMVLCGCTYEVISEGGDVEARIAPPTGDFPLRRRLLVTNPFAHGSLMWRRSTGVVYDPDYEYAEDYRLISCLSELGRLGSHPEVLYRWRNRPGNMPADRWARKGARFRAVRDTVWVHEAAIARARRPLELLAIRAESHDAQAAIVLTELKLLREAALRHDGGAVRSAVAALGRIPWSSWGWAVRDVPVRLAARRLRRRGPGAVSSR